MPKPQLLAPQRAGLRVLTSVASACLIAAALAAPATAGPSTAPRAAHTSTAQQEADRSPEARLRGSREVPGPGDPNGKGEASLRLKPATNKVCASVTWERIGRPIAAHIHRGRPGVSGPVVVDLSGSVTGGAKCATGVRKALIRKIIAHPHAYYFNIHTNAYQAGAIRGQLH